MRLPGQYTLPVHFEDFDGSQFERLVYAYHLRASRWRRLEWYGQVGSDSGRDIWGVREDGSADGETVCIQCANRLRLTFQKARADIDKVSPGPDGIPDRFILVCRCNVGADLRDRIQKHAQGRGIHKVDFWSGQEFEERLRKDAEPLLRRFLGGEGFPESPAKLALFAGQSAIGDPAILANLASLFDRPAFHTPFHQESSLPDFKKAITDTIEALNTGVHRLRDGTEIRRFPSRHTVQDQSIRDALSVIERRLCHLRSKYDELVRNGEIKPCACGKPECSIYFFSPRAIFTMDRLRCEVLAEFGRVYPSSNLHFGWPDFSTS